MNAPQIISAMIDIEKKDLEPDGLRLIREARVDLQAATAQPTPPLSLRQTRRKSRPLWITRGRLSRSSGVRYSDQLYLESPVGQPAGENPASRLQDQP